MSTITEIQAMFPSPISTRTGVRQITREFPSDHFSDQTSVDR